MSEPQEAKSGRVCVWFFKNIDYIVLSLMPVVEQVLPGSGFVLVDVPTSSPTGLVHFLDVVNQADVGLVRAGQRREGGLQNRFRCVVLSLPGRWASVVWCSSRAENGRALG